MDTQYVDDASCGRPSTPLLEPKATRQVKELLGKRYRFNPADERALQHVRLGRRPQEITDGIVDGLKLVLTFIGVLTLAIGGVGIMNIMFVIVQERTREIGIRKALGARRREILLQFLLEGLVTTFAGGPSASRCRACWCGCSARGRSWPSCSTTPAASTDIHLVLSLELLGVCSGDPDGRRSRQRGFCRRCARRGWIRSKRCDTNSPQ